MSQMSFSDFEYAGKRKQTRRERFLAEMEQVVPWSGGVWGAMEPKTNVSSESHRKGAFRSPAHPPGITL